MPEFPRYESQREIAIQPLALRRKGSEEKHLGISKVAKTALDVNVKWANAIDTMQYTTAKSTFESGIAEIKNRAILDPDYNGSEKYYKEIDQLKTDSLGGFTNNNLQRRVQLEFDHGSQMAGLEIDSIFKKKLLVNNQFELDKGIEALLDKQVSAPTPQLANQARQELIDLVKLNVARGTLSAKEGQKKVDDALHSVVKYDIYSDLSTEESQSEILAELRKGKKGRYHYLSADERLKLIGESQRRIAQNVQNMKAFVKEETIQRTYDMWNKVIDGTLTIRDIENARTVPLEEGGIPPNQLNSFQNGLVKGYQNDIKAVAATDEKAKRYNELITNFLDEKTDRDKAYELLAKLYSDQQLTSAEAKVLRPLVNALEDVEFSRLKFRTWRPIANLISFFRENVLTDEVGEPVSEEKELALAIKEYLKEVSKGEDPDVAGDKVLKDSVKNNFNWVNRVSKNGTVMMDKNGKKVRVFPDGSYEDIK